MEEKIFLTSEIGYILIDVSDETIKISISVESYNGKTVEYYRNCYVEKRMDGNEDCVNISANPKMAAIRIYFNFTDLKNVYFRAV